MRHRDHSLLRSPKRKSVICPHPCGHQGGGAERSLLDHDLVKNGPVDKVRLAGLGLGRDWSKRGFASMGPQRQREIASLGGKAAHASGKAHEFNSSEAREAGRKGGRAGRRNADASGNSPSQS